LNQINGVEFSETQTQCPDAVSDALNDNVGHCDAGHNALVDPHSNGDHGAHAHCNAVANGELDRDFVLHAELDGDTTTSGPSTRSPDGVHHHDAEPVTQPDDERNP